MRTLLIAMLTIACGSPVATAAPPVVETPKQYRIEIKISRTTAEGQEAVVAEPCLVTIAGRPAHLHAGGNVAPPEESGAAPIDYGTSLFVMVTEREGQAYLDAALTVSEPDLSETEAVHISGVNVRVFEKLTLGKRLTIPMKPVEGMKCELTVNEFRPEALKAGSPAATVSERAAKDTKQR